MSPLSIDHFFSSNVSPSNVPKNIPEAVIFLTINSDESKNNTGLCPAEAKLNVPLWVFKTA